jgi:hypothetical protein
MTDKKSKPDSITEDNTSQLDLEPIKTRVAAAAPGPWRWSGGSGDTEMMQYIGIREPGQDVFELIQCRWDENGKFIGSPVLRVIEGEEDGYCPRIKIVSEADITFIAHSPEDMIRLVAEVERLRELDERHRKRNEKLRKLVKNLVSC